MAENLEDPITPTLLLGATGTGPTDGVGVVDPATGRALLQVALGATANATDAQLRDRATHTGAQAISTITGLQTALNAKVDSVYGRNGAVVAAPGDYNADQITETGTNKIMTAAERTKLAGVATGATANATDSFLRDRANHTGAQATSTVTGLDTALGLLAPKNNATLTGVVTVPTLPGSTNNDQAASTAMVQSALSTVSGGLDYLGNWNAATNTPTLSNASGVANSGGFYIVSVAGTTTIDGISSWAVGDWIISDDVGWKKIAQSNAVASVFGRTGVIVSASNDYNADQITETLTNKIMTAAERTKLAGVATGATANATDAQLRDRTTHTGAQAISTVTGLQTALDSKTTTVFGRTGAVVAVSGDYNADLVTETATNKILTATERTKLAGIEVAATADQTNVEIETAYNAQVPIISQVEAEAGTSTAVRRITAERIKQAILALAPGGGAGGIGKTAVNQGTPGTTLGTSEIAIGTVAITPTTINSKILVIGVFYPTKDTGTTFRTCTARLRRGPATSGVAVGNAMSTGSATASVPYGPIALAYVDTPGTTVSTTYSLCVSMSAASSSTATAFQISAVEVVSGSALDIVGLPINSAPDPAADYVPIYDASSASNQRTLISNLGAQPTFNTISVAGQPNVVADGIADTLTFIAGPNISITTDPSGDTISIAATSGGSGSVIEIIGDGVTDKTAALQSAIDYINTNYSSVAGPTTIRLIGRCNLNAATLNWGTRYGIRVEVDGGLILTSSYRVARGCSLIGIGGGGNANAQFAPGPYCLVTTNNFSGPAIWTAGDVNSSIEGVCVYGHSGGAAFHVGYRASDTGKTQTNNVRLKKVYCQCVANAASEGLRIENAFWVYLEDFAFVGDPAGGWMIHIADSWSPPIGDNTTDLVYIKNGIIGHKAVKFDRSGSGSSGYGYGFEFHNITYETCHAPWLTFAMTGGGEINMIRLFHLDIADAVTDNRFIYVDPVQNVKINEIMMDGITWSYGKIFDGKTSMIRGVNSRQSYGNFPDTLTMVEFTDQWIRDSIFTFEGEHYGPLAFRGSGHMPHMVPAGMSVLGISQTSSGWSTQIGNTPTYTAARTAPDGSATAVRIVTAAGGGQSLLQLGASGVAVGDWFIAGIWVRSNSATIPLAYGLDLYMPSGTWTLEPVEERQVRRKMLHQSSGKSGWVFCYVYDKAATVGGPVEVRMSFKTMDGTDCDVWNPFMIRVPAALGMSALDVTRLASHMTQVSPTASPGVVTQLDHQTFRTGKGVTGSRPSASAVGAGALWFDTTLNSLIWSNGSTWVVPGGAAAQVGSIPYPIETVTNKIYYIDKATFAYTINSLWQDVKGTVGTGSPTVAIKINGTNVTGLSAVALSAAEGETNATAANSVAIGDEVTAVVAGSTGMTDLFLRLKYTAS